MENNKELYVSPACEVLALRSEGLICTSVNDIEKGNEYEW